MLSQINPTRRRGLVAATCTAVPVAVALALVVPGAGSNSPSTASASAVPEIAQATLFTTTNALATQEDVTALRASLKLSSIKLGRGDVHSVALVGGARLSTFNDESGKKCFSVSTGPTGGASSGCGTDADIAAGRFSVAMFDPTTSGRYLVAGIAPDGVSVVSVDGTELSVKNNTYSGTVASAPQRLAWDSDAATTTLNFGG